MKWARSCNCYNTKTKIFPYSKNHDLSDLTNCQNIHMFSVETFVIYTKNTFSSKSKKNNLVWNLSLVSWNVLLSLSCIRPMLLQNISHLNLLQLEEQNLIDIIPTWKVTSTCILMLDKVQNLYAKIHAYHHQVNYSQIAGV